MIESFKTYRHKSNPKEKELHDKFFEEVLGDYVDFIVFPPENGSISRSEDSLSEREKRIVLSTIQWLGSPVGRNFLSGCGFELKEK